MSKGKPRRWAAIHHRLTATVKSSKTARPTHWERTGRSLLAMSTGWPDALTQPVMTAWIWRTGKPAMVAVVCSASSVPVAAPRDQVAVQTSCTVTVTVPALS
jgi:hypothetical protein